MLSKRWTSRGRSNLARRPTLSRSWPKTWSPNTQTTPVFSKRPKLYLKAVFMCLKRLSKKLKTRTKFSNMLTYQPFYNNYSPQSMIVRPLNWSQCSRRVSVKPNSSWALIHHSSSLNMWSAFTNRRRSRCSRRWFHLLFLPLMRKLKAIMKIWTSNSKSASSYSWTSTN